MQPVVPAELQLSIALPPIAMLLGLPDSVSVGVAVAGVELLEAGAFESGEFCPPQPANRASST